MPQSVARSKYFAHHVDGQIIPQSQARAGDKIDRVGKYSVVVRSDAGRLKHRFARAAALYEEARAARELAEALQIYSPKNEAAADPLDAQFSARLELNSKLGRHESYDEMALACAPAATHYAQPQAAAADDGAAIVELHKRYAAAGIHKSFDALKLELAH